MDPHQLDSKRDQLKRQRLESGGSGEEEEEEGEEGQQTHLEPHPQPPPPHLHHHSPVDLSHFMFTNRPLAHSTPTAHSLLPPTTATTTQWTRQQQHQLAAAHYFTANYGQLLSEMQQHQPGAVAAALLQGYGYHQQAVNGGSGGSLHASSTEGSSSSMGGVEGVSLPTSTDSNENSSLALFNSLYGTVLPQPQPTGVEVFCSVPGRLTLLSNTKKYRVTVAEVQRRISPPECLNASILGGILRKAKNKNGGVALRDQLGRHGLTLPSGRRKSAPTTAFTSLVEEETGILSRDFADLCRNHYPHKAAATHALSGVHSPQAAHEARMELFYAKRFLARLSSFHEADKSPIGDQRPKLLLDPELQKGLTNFSMLTHGFGGPAVQAVLALLDGCISECTDALDTQFPSPGSSSNNTNGNQQQ